MCCSMWKLNLFSKSSPFLVPKPRPVSRLTFPEAWRMETALLLSRRKGVPAAGEAPRDPPPAPSRDFHAKCPGVPQENPRDH